MGQFELIDQAFWIRLAISVFCGFILGFERQIKGKPVGVRTSILICVGTMSFVCLGTSLGGGQDPTRVLGQIITGVGFLGAGVIMNLRGHIIGVTSAAVVWLLAAIGSAIGMNHYAYAIGISLAAVVILMGVEFLESHFPRIFRRGVHSNRSSTPFPGKSTSRFS